MGNPVTLGGLAVAINYLNRDYESIRQDLITRAKDPNLFPEWNNFSPTDPGVGLIELVSHVFDILSYYQDRWGNEGFIRTAFLRRSVIDLLEKIGYILRPPTAAQVTAQINYQNVPGGGFTRLAGTIYSTEATPGNPAINFELLADLIVPADGTLEAELVHATSIGPETFGQSNGGVNQTFKLAQSGLVHFIDGSSSLVVEVDEGTVAVPLFVQWIEVDNFADSRPDDRHYRTFTDEDQITFVIFSDGAIGRIPPTNGDVRGNYKIGGGIAGNNVPRNSITETVSGGLPGGVTETLTNAAQPSGGLDRESIESAKFWAPKQFKTHGSAEETTMRAITHEDYEAVAHAGGAIAARAGRGLFPHIERIVVAVAGANPVPSGSWDIVTQTGSGALGSIGAFVLARNGAGKILELVKPVVVDIEATIKVHILSGFRQSSILDLVRTELLDKLSIANLGFTAELPISRPHQLMENLTGIDHPEDVVFRRQPVIWGTNILAESSKAAFSNLVMADIAVDQVYTLTFLTSTTFQVESDVSGIQAQSGDLSGGPITWVSDSEDLQIDVDTGAVLNVSGDSYQIRTMPKIGSIISEGLEILRLQDVNLILQAVGGIPG